MKEACSNSPKNFDCGNRWNGPEYYVFSTLNLVCLLKLTQVLFCANTILFYHKHINWSLKSISYTCNCKIIFFFHIFLYIHNNHHCWTNMKFLFWGSKKKSRREIKYEVPHGSSEKRNAEKPREFSLQFKMHVIGNFYWATLSISRR